MQTRRDRNRKDSSDIDSDSSEHSQSSSEEHNEVPTAPILQKRPYNLKKKMDNTVEEPIDVEFIIRQETLRSQIHKEHLLNP